MQIQLAEGTSASIVHCMKAAGHAELQDRTSTLRGLLEAKGRQIFSAAPPAPRWGGLYLDLLRVDHIADLAVVQ